MLFVVCNINCLIFSPNLIYTSEGNESIPKLTFSTPFDVAHDIFISLSTYLLDTFEQQWDVFLDRRTFRGYQRADVRTIMTLESGGMPPQVEGENEGILAACYRRILQILNHEARAVKTDVLRNYVEQQKEQMKRLIMEITVNAMKAEGQVQKHDIFSELRAKGKEKIGSGHEKAAKQLKKVESFDSEVSYNNFVFFMRLFPINFLMLMLCRSRSQ